MSQMDSNKFPTSFFIVTQLVTMFIFCYTGTLRALNDVYSYTYYNRISSALVCQDIFACTAITGNRRKKKETEFIAKFQCTLA